MHGWALAMQGRVDEGLSEMRTSLAEQTAAGSLIAQPQFLAMVADACLSAKRYDEALAASAQGLECSAATSDHYWDSELVRLRGETLCEAGGDIAEIDACFRRAITDARERGAKSMELRAATSAARVWQRRGDRALARETLAPVYGWFTEGFGTADLIAARTLLESLS